jgi:hypothetical protein
MTAWNCSLLEASRLGDSIPKVRPKGNALRVKQLLGRVKEWVKELVRKNLEFVGLPDR